jgi:phosphoserine phosphatase RsbU/P
MLQMGLDEVLPDAEADLVDTAVLLASELAENAVLHAGTEFEVALTVTDEEVRVEVTDRGSGPLEAHLAQPRRTYGRAASHGRGLALVQRLASAWGTRHDGSQDGAGRHTIWFHLARTPVGPAGRAPAAPPDVEHVLGTAEQARWLLHMPAALTDRLHPEELVAELVRRLREVLGAASVSVDVDEGEGVREVARAGEPGADAGVVVPLPMTAPLHGVLRVVAGPSGRVSPDRARDLAELIAHRVAMAVESRWLRVVDQRRRAWTTYLAETSELLGQSLDADLAVAVVPQVVVPRLGRWCAVLLVDATGRWRLAALTHADEEELPELRAVLDPDGVPGLPLDLRRRLDALAGAGRAAALAPGAVRDGDAPIRFAAPTEGTALPLRVRGTTIGVLLVGRPDGRPHGGEDVVLAADIARRAALAIHNAQSTAAHVAVSQALQQALLPRALPVVPGLEFAALYLPASTGSDVGGDFYDVLTVDPTRWLVSIGDVCGKGARAAARTGLVRDVLRVLVREGRPLPEAVATLNEVMMEAGDPLQFCTLAAAVVSRPPAGAAPGLDVDLVLAGHPQPVLVRADGTAELVGEFGTAVGLVPRVRVRCTTHRLAPGDTLLVHTDGVAERRHGAAQFGPDRLLAAASAAADRPPAQLIAAVREAVDRFSADPLGDDMALLAVRVTP